MHGVEELEKSALALRTDKDAISPKGGEGSSTICT